MILSSVNTTLCLSTSSSAVRRYVLARVDDDTDAGALVTSTEFDLRSVVLSLVGKVEGSSEACKGALLVLIVALLLE